MIFYAGKKGLGEPISLRKVRILVTTALVAYPTGAMIQALATTKIPGRAVGFALVVVAIFAAAGVIGTSIQRIVGERVQLLDEFELKLRQRAMSKAYAAFTVLVLAATMYAGIAHDAGWWLPAGDDAYNGLFWGAFLYAALLPTFFLVWDRQSSSELSDETTGPVE